MLTRCFTDIDALEPYRDVWDRLAAGSVFRCWTWLGAWWRHYGAGSRGRELQVWLAFDDPSESPDSVRAVLPTYLESSWVHGRQLRLLGDGEVCSDHLGLLAAPNAADAAMAIAAAMVERCEWDLIDFSAVDDDGATLALWEAISRSDCTTSRLAADRCWAIDLPPTWEEFLTLQSKSHRKQIRQMERRVLQSGRAAWRLVDTSAEFGEAWSTLVDLHQRRRQRLGEPGCFASPRWAAFHWDVAQRLLTEGRLRLSTLTLDGAAVAAEYHLAGGDSTWAYQGGVDPDRLADEPGQLSTICSIQRAIAEGCARFDFLRGDEPYKAHWRAAPRQALRLLAVPNRLWPQARRRVWRGAERFGRLTRQLANLFG